MADRIQRIYPRLIEENLTPVTGETTPVIIEEAAEILLADDAAAASIPYSEFGGLRTELAEHKQKTAAAREQAAAEWTRQLAAQSKARLALAERMRPVDNSDEQKRLRRLALGQSFGELIGSLFGGVIGLGRSGRGYVPAMPGRYVRTNERLKQLREYDIAANRRFNGLLAQLREKDAADAATLATENYREALHRDRKSDELLDYVRKQGIQAANRQDLAHEQAAIRSDLQNQRHEQRLVEQKNRAGNRTQVSDDVAYLTGLLLPKKIVTKQNGKEFPVRTERDATSYSKPLVAAKQALARQIAPVRKRHGLSDYDVIQLQEAIEKNPSFGATWEQIDTLLANDVSVDDIISFIS